MSNGFTGIILRVDLNTNKIEKISFPKSFYRKYLGGGAIGAYFLLKETTSDSDPFDESNILTIAPSVTTGCAVSGASRCSVVAISPLTNAAGEGQAGGSIGPVIKQAGYDAIVIKGKAGKLSYLFIDNDIVEIRDASHLSGRSVGQVYDELNREIEEKEISIIQCGPAGEKRVRFASLMVDRNNVAGRTGLGAIMGGKNLRAIAVHGDNTISFANPEALKTFNRLARERLPNSGFPRVLQKSGTPGILALQANSGNIATNNFKSGFHKNYKQLDVSSYEKKTSAGKTACRDCVIECRKRVKSVTPYKVSDKLGGPEFETLALLGTNLNITEPTAVAKANELCNEYGLDTITTGALAAYFFESMEQGFITTEQTAGETFGFGSPESLFRLIEYIAGRKGVGDILAEGFEFSIRHFGKSTKLFAIHCKGQGLPAHMAQVKPSQALMYAACPVGGDHMSSEHDWFLNTDNEEAAGMGISISEGDDKRPSTLSRVRMTVYTQYFFSLLDTLTLCMFIWGPGNLFSYRELEDLIEYTTGWKSTLWELMKAGERKTNMMRQINARRGFSSKNDLLPDRLYEPLTDGPSKGAYVDRDQFAGVLKQYYGLMGWNTKTGNPTSGKLRELGLEWTI